ncbi:hypothetical protein [Morganella morganii]|nr:hypothetical protein [Morganella morganii]
MRYPLCAAVTVSDYSVRRFGTRDLNPESPGHMICESQNKS